MFLHIFLDLKSHSLPVGVSAKTIEKYSSIGTSNYQTNTLFENSLNQKLTATGSKLLSKSFIQEEVKHRSITTNTVTSETVMNKTEKREEIKNRSEEGFFRRFINRSGRKKIFKDNDLKEVSTVDAKDLSSEEMEKDENHGKVQSSPFVIEKSESMSILDVLANARASENLVTLTKPLPTSYSSVDDSGQLKFFLPKIEKPRSGPASRQRVFPQDISTSSSTDLVGAKTTAAEVQNTVTSTEKSEFAGFTKSAVSKSYRCESKYMRQSQYRSEEYLSLTKNSSADPICDSASGPQSISLPKSVWPNENKFTQSPTRSQASARWNHCQQKSSKPNELTTEENGSPTKSIEKSKSFRLYTKETERLGKFKTASGGNMPSLPDLTTRTHTMDDTTTARHDTLSLFLNRFSETGTGYRPSSSYGFDGVSSSTHDQYAGINKFEIHDFSLLPNSNPLPADTKPVTPREGKISMGDIVLPQKSHGHQNIHQIEDNIDQIMKSSLTTILKKSPTSELYQVKATADKLSSGITDAGEKKILGKATVASPPLLRHSLTASKLDFEAFSPSKRSENVPEFIQIQFGRANAGRPKSVIDHATSISADDEKERRLSSESIEIADQRTSGPMISIRDKAKSTESVGKTRSRGMLATPDSSEDTRSTDDSELDDISCGNPERPREVFLLDSRKSVSDKKLKYEKKIEEIQDNIRRSSTCGSALSGLDKIGIADPRRSSIEDGTSVVQLRNKRSSTSTPSGETDGTPELMKVFARRSLKIKDPNDYRVYDSDTDAYQTIELKTEYGRNNNVDSDKENQSVLKNNAESIAKEEKVSTNGSSKINNNSVALSAPIKNITAPLNVESTTFLANVINVVAPSSIKEISDKLTKVNELKIETDSSKPPTNRLSSTQSSFFQSRHNSINIQKGFVASRVSSQLTNTDGSTNISPVEIKTNQNNNVDESSVTASINNNNMESAGAATEENSSQFKGILERRTMWEKRANQAFK